MGGIRKRLKGLIQKQNRNKAWEADIAVRFSCEPVQIKSYCKKEAEERKRNHEKGSEEVVKDDSRGLRTEEGQQPTGQHQVDSRGPFHRMQDRKGQAGTHLCGRSQPCVTDAP